MEIKRINISAKAERMEDNHKGGSRHANKAKKSPQILAAIIGELINGGGYCVLKSCSVHAPSPYQNY